MRDAEWFIICKIIVQSQPSQHAVLLEDLFQGLGAKVLVIWHHLDDTGQVGKQVALVSVGQNGRHRGIVEFNILVVDLDEMNRRVGLDQWHQH